MPVYAGTEPPTIPSEVNHDTQLDSLRLNWREKELPEKARTKHVHRLHPYLGKFIPQLAEIFIRKFFEPNQTILDPFCGSGTALVQANELGINAIGYDISAFNVMLSRAKIRKYNIEKVKTEVLDALEKLRGLTQSTTQLGFWEERADELKIPQTDNEYLPKWYAPRTLNELLAYRYLIQNEGYLYQDLLKIILSRSARSARLTTHYDLDFPKNPQAEPYWCYKHSRTCSPTMEAFKFINRYSLDTLRRVEEFAKLRTTAISKVRHADSRRAKFPPIDGVITSPPYVGLIDYHDQHAYAYHLFGLKDRRQAEIGPAVNGSSQKAQRQYQLDI
ncbi:DNA adenine methylase, partial [bacterium]|nr:DNA adenine methylase [bacterium]